MIKGLKLMCVVPAYLFLVCAGFIGSTSYWKDNWDKLYQWAMR